MEYESQETGDKRLEAGATPKNTLAVPSAASIVVTTFSATVVTTFSATG